MPTPDSSVGATYQAPCNKLVATFSAKPPADLVEPQQAGFVADQLGVKHAQEALVHAQDACAELLARLLGLVLLQTVADAA